MSERRNRVHVPRVIWASLVAILCALAAPAFASAHTVVSLEFDDGVADQYQILPMLESHGMNATFFVNSGVIGGSSCISQDSGANNCSHMTWSQLHDLADAGNEIGGHTVAHANLPPLDTGEQQREVCNDRVTLANQGFSVTDFAYPYGAQNSTTQSVVQNCGYNSARDVKGIVSPGECSGCPFAESVPPANPFDTRTPENVQQTTSLSTIEGYVTQAERNGGGWVQLVFHHVCDGCDLYGITPSNFSSLLDWLQARQGNDTVVKTVHDVVGGPVQPLVNGPAPPPPPGGSNLVWNPSFEATNTNGIPNCFEFGQYGSNTASMSQVGDAHTGSSGEQLNVSNYTSGDAKILTQQDLGSCAPTLSSGTKYQISAWYKSSAPTLFILFARNALGGYSYWTESPLLSASSTWTQATWTTPPLPAGDTGFSFGLGLVSNGTLTVDDYSLGQAPAQNPSGNMLQNTSLENTDASGIPSCWQTGNGGGTNSGTWTHSTNAHSGSYAEQVQITSYTSGDQKLVSRQDTGSCAPNAKAGHTYNVSAWYTSNQPVHLVAYYHVPGTGTGTGWIFWAQSGSLPASSTYTQANWTTPAFPANADMISVGTSLRATGTMTVDDVSLADSDTVAPTVSLTAPNDSSTVSGSVPISANAADSDGQIDHVEFLVNGQLVGSSSTAPYSFNWDSTSVSNGSYTMTARAVDWGGNATVSSPVTVKVSNGPPPDNTAPTVSLASPPDGSNLSGSVALAANASDDVGLDHVDFLVDGNVVATSSSPPYTAQWDSSTVSDGQHVISARAVDTSGNIASDPHTVIVDNTAPSSSASAPPSSSSDSVQVDYTAADVGSGIAGVTLFVKPPGASSYIPTASDTSGATAGTFTYTAAAGDGTYSFLTQAVDNAGNFEAAHATADATTVLDTTAPSSLASTPAATKSSPISVSFSANDAGSGVAEVDLYAKGPNDSSYHEVVSDTSGESSGPLSYNASQGDGSYSFYTLATDKFGNAEMAHSSADATTVLDTAAPTSSANAPATARTTSISVPFTASDSGSGVGEVDLYAKGPGDSSYNRVATDTTGNGTGAFSFTASEGDGSYSFYSVSTDQAGNVESTPASAESSTLLSTVAPSSTASAQAMTDSNTFSVSYATQSGTDPAPLAQVDLYVKGPSDSGYALALSDLSGNASGSFQYTASEGDGTYNFYTVATDSADNAELAPATADALTLVDTKAPSSSGSAPATTNSSQISVSFSASDSGSGLAEVDLYAKGPSDSSYNKVASNTSGAGSGSFNYSASEGDGSYRFYTAAVDKAGNVEAAHSGADATTVLDTGAPSSSASTLTSAFSAPINVSYTAADNQGGAGLDEVDLYVRGPNDSTYSRVARDTAPGASGSFNYSPTEGNGSYRFYTLAIDNAGNTEAVPASPDATTSYLKDTTAPTSKATSPSSVTTNTWNVSYTASDNQGGSGLASVELWVKAPGATSYNKAATGTSSATSGTFSYTATAGDGSYTSYTIAVDKAGNRESTPGTADATTVVDTGPPSAFQMSDPGQYLRGTVSMTLSSVPTDSGSGMASLTYQYRSAGSTGSWSTACKSTSAPWSCNWKTTAIADGQYDLQAIATDKVGNSTTASNAPLTGRAVDNTKPTAKSISTTNAGGGTRGKAETGDTMTFTYSEAIRPSSVLAGWNGTSTAVQVRMSGSRSSSSTLTIWNAGGSNQLPLANPLALGGIYNSTNSVVFNATMVQNGSAITVTLGPISSGTVAITAVRGGTITWTPSSGATDLAGNSATTSSASSSGPAF